MLVCIILIVISFASCAFSQPMLSAEANFLGISNLDSLSNNWKIEITDSVENEFIEPNPGPGGCSGITVFRQGIENTLQDIVNNSHLYHNVGPNFINDFGDLFRLRRRQRAIAHELGHMLGIDHHCVMTNSGPSKEFGNWECVMKYESIVDLQLADLHWNNWLESFGSGYYNDSFGQSEFNCLNERSLRPVDENSWP